MTCGKRLSSPKIKIFLADQPRYKSMDDAWQVVGPLLAQMLAEMMKSEKQNNLNKSIRKRK